MLDSSGRVTAASRSARDLWQTGATELVGEFFPSLIAIDVVSEDADWTQAQWEVLLAATLDKTAVLSIQPREGAPRPMAVRTEKAMGSSDGYVALVQPPPAEAASAQANENAAAFQLFIERGAAGFFELNLKTKRVRYSPAWKRMLGYGDADLPDTYDAWLALIHPDDSAAAPDKVGRKLTVGTRPFTVQFRMKHRQGSWVWILCVGLQVVSAAGELERVLGIHIDATDFLAELMEEPEAPEAAAHPAPAAHAADSAQPAGFPPSADALTQEAFSALAEGVVITDAGGKVLFVNSAAGRLLQVPPETAVGQAVGEIFKLVDRQSGRPGDDPSERAISADKPLPLAGDQALVAPDGATVPVVWTARAVFGSDSKPRGVAIVFRNPDEMSLTPEELVKANRFESLGLLAGGIAHDFNNLLTTILGAVSLAKDSKDPSALADAEKACLTAKGLTKQLLAFAKGGAGVQTVCAAREILDDAVKIAAAGATAVITVEAPEGAEPVQVDRAQILQVFQNLVVNALQAMPPAPHKAQIQLRAGNVQLAEGQVPSLAAGDYVEFEVRDNGSGIKPEHLEKIWDPFFTTKKHGTGLGLATVLSIVRKHGGQIGLDSKEGVGTAFSVYLPRADKPVDVQARKAPSLRFGTGRVLFMDDDEKICALTSSMLTGLNYKFDIAKNGEEAITFYKRYLNIGRPYDAVIMDLTVIGGMGGEEAFKALRELDPDVRAIVSSGYDNDEMARQYLDMGFCGYLTKPYRVTELGKVIKAVLG